MNEDDLPPVSSGNACVWDHVLQGWGAVLGRWFFPLFLMDYPVQGVQARVAQVLLKPHLNRQHPAVHTYTP